MKLKEERRSKVGKYTKIAIGMSIFAIFLVVIYAIVLITLTWPIDKYTIQNAGVFGDSFGVLTSLFSALAFGGVVFTWLNQKEQVNIQKKELEENRVELKKQGFENSFFQMLKLHNQIVGGISQSISGIAVTTEDGRVVLKRISDSLVSYINGKDLQKKGDLLFITDGYEAFAKRYGFQLAHYFRFLYNIYRFLSDAGYDKESLYARLLRAQLSNQELLLIYYNSLSSDGEKFKEYIKEFKLMDNLPRSYLVHPKHADYVEGAGFKNEP